MITDSYSILATDNPTVQAHSIAVQTWPGSGCGTEDKLRSAIRDAATATGARVLSPISMTSYVLPAALVPPTMDGRSVCVSLIVPVEATDAQRAEFERRARITATRALYDAYRCQTGIVRDPSGPVGVVSAKEGGR